MEAGYEVHTVIPLLFCAQILPLDEELTSSQAHPLEIYAERMYIYNVCGWWVEYWAQEDWIYNLEGKSTARLMSEGVRRISSCLLYTYKSLSVILLPLRPSPALYLDWAGYLPVSCQHRRYGTRKAGTHAKMEGTVVCHWEFGDRLICAPITAPLLSHLSTQPFTLCFHPLHEYFSSIHLLCPSSAHHGRLLHFHFFFYSFSLGASNRGCCKLFRLISPPKQTCDFGLHVRKLHLTLENCKFYSAFWAWIYSLHLFLKLQPLTPGQCRQWDVR